jgi:dTDP-4-dehydrorhamnose reductase
MKPLKVLVIGSQGQLARAINELAANAGIKCSTVGRPLIDLADSATIGPKLVTQLSGATKPNIVINTAAYTHVDAAEKCTGTAARINAAAPGEIAATCARVDIPLIHISTDYVFSGEKAQPWLETDVPAPTSVYGRTKLEGEKVVALTWHKHVIIRTSWLYSRSLGNFYATIDRLSQTGEMLRVVADQTGCPTYAPNFAKVILKVAQQVVDGNPYWGIFNYCDDTSMSWAQFATSICDSVGRTKCKIEPVSTEGYGAIAPRPVWSVLDCQRIEQAYGVTQASFGDALRLLATKP